MKRTELKKGIYWVGGIDWKLKDFHGYVTQRGSTYNAYLIVDRKIVLVDTVKHYLFDEMLTRIREIVDPADIDYIVSNHVEMDHSGSIPALLNIAPGAKVLTSTRGEKGLRKHYGGSIDLTAVESGESLDIGDRTLNFTHTPMVHWPDNMVTYIPEEKILLSNDAFGQHIASSERFDDEIEWGIAREEAAKYYANIVMPYSAQVKKALEALSGLDIEMIAPSHGIIWREGVGRIIDEYRKWSNSESSAEKGLIVYDTMWGSTEKIAYALSEGMEEEGVDVTLRSLKHHHISDIMTEVLRSRFIMIGSPTLNNGMLPSVGEFLTYLKGLRPAEKTGLVFGSYGWGGQAAGEIEEVLKKLKWELPLDKININYIPDAEKLEEVKKAGREVVTLSKQGS